MDLGARIRTIRKQKKMTLVELSQSTGVAQASLSRIETGIMNGTVESHRKISEALGMSLAELYKGLDPKAEEISYQSHEDAKQSAVIKNDDIRLELLTTQLNIRKFAPVLITIPSEKTVTFEKLARGTDKFLWIQAGNITVTVDGKDYTLHTNDTIYFDASFGHSLKNTKTETAKVLSVTSPATM